MGLERIMATVGMDGSGFEVGAKRISSTAEKLGSNIEHSLKGAIAAAFSTAAIEEIIRRTVEFGDRISDLSKRLGMTAEKFQELRYAFTTTGGSEQGLTSFLERLSTSREKALGGDAGALNNFKRLGVTASDLQGKRSDELMSIIGKSIEEGNIENLRAPLRAVGGKGAGELIAGFKEGLLEKGREAREAGAVISNTEVAELKAAKENLEQLATTARNTFVPAMIDVLHVIEDISDMARFALAYIGAKPEQSFAELRQRKIKEGGMGLFSFPNVAAFGEWLGQKSVAGDQASKLMEDIIAARRAREAQAIANANKPPPAGVNIPAAEPAFDKLIADHDKAFSVDAMQRMGGFIGVGAEMPLVNIAREQLATLKSIDAKLHYNPASAYGEPGQSTVDGD